MWSSWWSAFGFHLYMSMRSQTKLDCHAQSSLVLLGDFLICHNTLAVSTTHLPSVWEEIAWSCVYLNFCFDT